MTATTAHHALKGHAYPNVAAPPCMQVEHCRQRLKTALPGVHQVAQGGTAVGTGLNSWKGFDQRLCDILSQDLGITFQPAANKFEALASHDAMVHLHGALNTLATALFKVGSCRQRLIAAVTLHQQLHALCGADTRFVRNYRENTCGWLEMA